MLTLAKEIDDDLDEIIADVKDEIKDLVFAIEKDDKEWISLINKRLKEKYGTKSNQVHVNLEQR